MTIVSSQPGAITYGGMNFLQLCNRLRLECGVSGADLTSVASQTGEPGRLVAWVNSAWLDIQNTRTDWQWMRTTATFPTATGQPTYTPTQIGLTDFGSWARETFRNYVNPVVTLTIASPCVVTLTSHNLLVGQTVDFFTTGFLPTAITADTTCYVASTPTPDTFTFSLYLGGPAVNTAGTQSGVHSITSNNTTTFVGFKSEIFMSYLDYEWWRNGYEYGALRQVQTRPTVMTVAPDKSIGLGPNPIVGYTVVGDYYRVPTEMTANTDTPALPSQFRMAIIYRAMMSYGAYESAPEVAQRGASEFNRLMRRIHSDRMPEITAGGALA